MMAQTIYGDLEHGLRDRIIEKCRALRHQSRATYQMGSDDALDRQAADAISKLRDMVQKLESTQPFPANASFRAPYALEPSADSGIAANCR